VPRTLVVCGDPVKGKLQRFFSVFCAVLALFFAVVVCMFSPEELAPTLAPLGLARPLPARAYLDDAVLRHERAFLLRRSWTCVAREQELALPGETLVVQVAGVGLLLTRGADLALRGFHDVCQHRGACLGEPGFRRVPRLVCPYHGWTYDLDGRLRSTPPASGPPAGHPGSWSLEPAAVAEVAGLIFACPGEPWGPAESAFEGLSEELARSPLRRLRLGRRVEHQARANWKLLAENFLESHHFPPVHPELERITPTEHAGTLPPRGAWFGGTMEIRPPSETVAPGGSLGGRPLLGSSTRTVRDYLIFPSCMLSVQPDYLLVYRLWPEAADLTRITSEIWFAPSSAADPSFDPAPVFSFWDTVNAQDRTICERQQRGLASPGFRGGCYTAVEESSHRFAAMVARSYLDQSPW
jgi:Rieske 2Fe-2S family protein